MIWLFARGRETLELATHFSKATDTYDIIRRRADGTATKESFRGETAFRGRLAEIQTELDSESWTTDGPRLVADSWKI